MGGGKTLIPFLWIKCRIFFNGHSLQCRAGELHSEDKIRTQERVRNRDDSLKNTIYQKKDIGTNVMQWGNYIQQTR